MSGSQSDLTPLHYQAGEMLESYYKLQPKLKTVLKFIDALWLIWSALPVKAINRQRCERQPQLTAGIVCQTAVKILNM